MTSLSDVLGAGLDDRKATTGVWRDQPVSFDEFLQSEQHLNLGPLYSRQREAIRKLLGDDPTKVFEPREFQTVVCCYGKGSGKDYLASVAITYLVYVLLCLNDPQEYLGLAPGESADILNVAQNAQQARSVFYSKLRSRVQRWAWLRDRYNIVEAGRPVNAHRPGLATVRVGEDSIEFPGHIRAWSRHAQHEGWEGLNIVAFVLDEAAGFLSPSKRECADAIWRTLRSSAASRFGQRWVGAVLSYPRHADDFVMTLLRQAQANPQLGIHASGPFSTWEVNDKVAAEPRVKIRDVEVPVSLAADFEMDFEDSLGRYMCRPPKARDAFFRYPEHLWQSVQKGREPAIRWEPTVIEREQGDGSTRRLRGVRLTRTDPLPAGTRLYCHGDPGLTNDAFALAVGYAAPATIMTTVPASEVYDEAVRQYRGLESESPVAWERDVTKMILIGLIVWRPDPREGIAVDLQNVEDTILELKRVYPTIGHRTRTRHGESKPRPTFTTDHWQAAQTIQRLAAKKLNARDEMWSRDFQVDIYRTARSMFANGLIELPDAPEITSKDPASPGAIYELERVEFIDGSKIDHPAGGGKDLSDALVRVAQHAHEHNTSTMGFAKVLGRPSGDPESPGVSHRPVEAQIAAAARPETLADLVRPDLERQERIRQRVMRDRHIAPLPAEAPERRMGFGTVSSKHPSYAGERVDLRPGMDIPDLDNPEYHNGGK